MTMIKFDVSCGDAGTKGVGRWLLIKTFLRVSSTCSDLDVKARPGLGEDLAEGFLCRKYIPQH